MLESQTFWLSEYTALNDPSEFAYARGQLFGLLQRREIFMDTIARYCVVAAVEGLSSNTGLMIGSFTARRDDLGQWRSYANNGRGCVLGLDTRYLEHDAGVAIRTVVYDEELVSRMLKLGLGVVQEQYAGQPDDPSTLMEYGRHLAADLFTIKHPCFADEREVENLAHACPGRRWTAYRRRRKPDGWGAHANTSGCSPERHFRRDALRRATLDAR